MKASFQPIFQKHFQWKLFKFFSKNETVLDKIFCDKIEPKFVWNFSIPLSQCCKEKKLGAVGKRSPQHCVEERRGRKNKKFGICLIIYVQNCKFSNEIEKKNKKNFKTND